MKRIAIAVIALITAATSAHAATRITVGSGGNGSASVPVATTSTAGKVKPDGSTITVETDGTIHAAATGNVTLGTTNGLSLSGQVLSLSAATDSTAGAMSAADHAAMPTTLAKLVAIELAAAPRKIYMVYGDSTDGGDTPDSTTQASIDALLDAGVPQANIRWMYEVDDTNTFTIANLADSTTIENVVLTQHGGTFAVADMGSATAIDNVTISSGDVLVFAVADLAAATTIDNVVLSLAGGTLAVADMASATTTENVVLAAGTSAPTTPVISVTPGDSENVIALTSGGTGATSYDIKWGTVAGTRSNTISGVTLPYTHTGRTNGATYYYSLVATNAGGSTESAEVSGTPVAATLFSIDFENYTVPTTTLLSPLTTTAGTNTVETAFSSKRLKQIGGTNIAVASFATNTGLKVTAKVRQIGSSSGSEGMFASLIAVAPNGTDYYRLYLDARTSGGSNVFTKNGTQLLAWSTPPFTDNNEHAIEFIINGGVLTINVDGVQYATYTDSDSPFTQFNAAKFVGAAATGAGSVGIYWDDLVGSHP